MDHKLLQVPFGTKKKQTEISIAIDKILNTKGFSWLKVNDIAATVEMDKNYQRNKRLLFDYNNSRFDFNC
ncbi:hypothetical protein QF042_001971 [Pedobacter sp. W3I1]|nr:hypothetical protein [Pedobacter sp. W3I1]